MVEQYPDRVVIIDDDAAVLESFQFMLELAGFPVCAYESASAYLHDGATRPCCIILDQHMPHMTGLEFATLLRAKGDETPILLITAAPTPALHAKAAACGVQRVLAKPTVEEDVIAFIRGSGQFRQH